MTGRIKRVPLREVWPHEAFDFTTYIQENLDLINEVTNLNLVGAEREQAAGAFWVDLLAEDEDGGTVVIENQLGRSDHDHLGKLLTYLAAFGAKAAVWIVGDARPEHVQAIAWLGESTAGDFYLIKAEAVRVISEMSESAPAPMLTLLVGPSAEAKGVGRSKQVLAGKHDLRYRFWKGLLSFAKTKTSLHSGISPGPGSWLETSALPGKWFLKLCYVIRQHTSRIELYIDRQLSAHENEAMFDQLYAKQKAIEAAAGHELSWQRLEGKRACRIAWNLADGGYMSDESQWPLIQERMVDAMVRFHAALEPHLRALQVDTVAAPAELVGASEQDMA
ncbi:MAG: DUF4268 domain-containing protein [Fimbriimonadaceae bacterium]|nr:DUF4268 domain-containing protein [Fimbriimonadaceae bacterium]QYK59098.1 MAG: DUF4268 domain-containing protein [Fimbriimonadaceae bacterium]